MTTPAAPVSPAPPAAPDGPKMTLEQSFQKAQEILNTSRAAAPVSETPVDETELIAPGDPAALDAPATPPSPAPPAGEVPVEGAAPPAVEGEAPPAPVEVEVIPLPGRRPEDPPFELEVPKGEAAERLRQALNNGMRGEEFDQAQASLQLERDEIEQESDRLVVDPVGYLTPQLPVEERAMLALQFLADPRALGAQLTLPDGTKVTVEERLTALLDPDSRADVVKDLRLERSETERDRSERLDERKTIRAARNEIKDIVHALIPPNLTEPQVQLFLRDAVGDLRRAVAASRSGFVHPRDVPQLLRPRLEALGMTEPQIAQAVLALARGGRRGRRPAGGAPPSPPTPPAPARVAAKPTAQQLQAGQDARAQHRSPPPGAGAPSPARDIPKGLTIEQAISAYSARKARAP